MILDTCLRTMVYAQNQADMGCTHLCKVQAERMVTSTISRAREGNTLLPSRKNSGRKKRAGGPQTTCPATQTSCHGSLGKGNKTEQHCRLSKIKHTGVRLSCMNWVLTPRPWFFSIILHLEE